ncbi:MAG: hypothetical protein AB1547_09395 [Thermodesulfobacteriota bacterium]
MKSLFWKTLCIGCCVVWLAMVSGCDSIDSKQESNFSLTLEANPTTLNTREYSNITATLTHTDKTVSSSSSSSSTTSSGSSATTITTGAPTPVPNYVVTFSFTQNQSGAKLTVVNNTTDANGKAFAIYQAGDAEGIDILQARIENGLTAKASVIVGTTTTTTTTMSTTTSTTTTTVP